MRALVLVILLASSTARAEQAALTHTSPLSPTGALVPAGHFERTQSLLAFYHELALGLTDGLEVRLGMPGLPVPVLGGDLQLRAALLPPTSPLHLVLGAGVVAEWINGADLWTAASATVAWRGLHATARALDHAGEDDRLLLVTAGAMRPIGARTALFVELGDVAVLHPGDCVDKHGRAIGCTDRWRGRGALVGVWWQLDDMSIGLSAAILSSGATTFPVLPLLSMRWDRAL